MVECEILSSSSSRLGLKLEPAPKGVCTVYTVQLYNSELVGISKASWKYLPLIHLHGNFSQHGQCRIYCLYNWIQRVRVQVEVSCLNEPIPIAFALKSCIRKLFIVYGNIS